MGVSTDGILFYGIELGDFGGIKLVSEEHEDWLSNHWDWETYYAARKGVVIERNEGYGDFYDRKKLLLEESGCSIGHHCSGDDSMLYVSVKEFSASRGDPVTLTAENLIPPSDAEEKLRAFCDVMGIVFDPTDIGWHLASYWG